MVSLSPSAIGHQTRQAFGLAGLAASVLRRSIGRRFPELAAEDRLAMVPKAAPVSAPISIRWNDHHVPFVEATTEHDGAVGLGIVHGHLRLAQTELMRRVAYGRLAEVVGEPAVELDTLLRLVDFPRASEASLALLPDETRAWAEGFAAGITAAAEAQPLPPEFDILGITPDPWTVGDIFAVSRLCSADYAWRVWRTLNPLREHEEWTRMWADLVGVAAVADEDIPVGAEALDEALPTTFTHTGSNAYAVAGRRTKSGAPLLASDPHHIITTPNLWLIAGMRTPAVSVWGFMIPALPIFGVGRNAYGAWGGTNLHATSSELIDLTGETLEERETTIAVRGKSPRTVTTRQSELGPVISDAKPFRMKSDTVALHWLGHKPSDEFTPFYAMMRAHDWPAFEDAVDAYALPGLNMIWAGTDGTIGKMIGAHVPRRPLTTPADLVISKADAHTQWANLLTGKDLPQSVDPEEGFVASANEAPVDPPVTISLFFAAEHRIRRIVELLSARTDLTLDDLKGFQLDVYHKAADTLARRLVGIAEGIGRTGPVLDAIKSWDGQYRADSRGALAFELFAAPLIDGLEARSPHRIVSPYWRPFSRLTRLVDAATEADLEAALGEALDAAEAPFAKTGTWGSLHRLRLAHPLTRIPWLKTRLPALDFPSGGTNDTLMKSMHPFTQKVHSTNFGANARFCADLADIDETYAVLLGGQDGWPGSRTMFDQVGHWRRGEQIRLPLRPESVASAFPYVTPITPVEAA
ncbi:penicillin acylase family protein [Acuticoccus sp. M5D2P5]|uniref:penicillin acylase family protein n=1 Tax=Acuticoccus kalidii TaxID=2910977 RepID=UPI001F3E468C|nr:penicillin acylase family protein [Acuticoccus kalidii]MCF3931939.1 penicillin acylase family protein [Acuticoccus kalidii]